MNDLETSKETSSLWRRLLWVTGVPAFVLLILVLGIIGYRESRDASELADVLLDLDETDPGWQLDEIEAARFYPPAKENSAALCRDLARMLGPKWPDPPLDDHFRHVPIGELLDARRKIVLEDEMTRLVSVRDIARRMVALPRGRHELEFKLNPLNTLLRDQNDLRKVAALFAYEMRYRANQDEVSEAVRAGRACVCVARSLYDEPTMISTLIRISIVHIGISGVERSLALGESNDVELAALGKLLADEEKQDLYLAGVRAERAMMYLLYKRTASGEIPTDAFAAVLHKDDWSDLDKNFGGDKRKIRRQIPQLLRMFNRAVEIARLPSHEQAAAEAALAAEMEPYPDLTAHLAGVQKVGAACRREAAQVAAMRGLIAVERYRMKHKKWPAKLADVAPEFLKAVPTDPFDGKALKMAKVADGVVVYSVGFDGVDDGGKLNRDRPTDTEGVDFGFQLWDVAKRRRPASPVVEDVPEEKNP